MTARVLTRAEVREQRERSRQASLWVPCGRCRARVGEPCRTPSGKLLTDILPAHSDRWRRIQDEYAKPRRYELLDDDPEFNLSKGDILICVPYPYDRKVTVLYRESDGFDPACNQYREDVRHISGQAGCVDPAAVREMESRLQAARGLT